MEEMYAKFHAWKESSRRISWTWEASWAAEKSSPQEGAADGPFVEAKRGVGGFMIVSAESLEEAMEVARECPES